MANECTRMTNGAMSDMNAYQETCLQPEGGSGWRNFQTKAEGTSHKAMSEKQSSKARHPTVMGCLTKIHLYMSYTTNSLTSEFGPLHQ